MWCCRWSSLAVVLRTKEKIVCRKLQMQSRSRKKNRSRTEKRLYTTRTRGQVDQIAGRVGCVKMDMKRNFHPKKKKMTNNCQTRQAVSLPLLFQFEVPFPLEMFFLVVVGEQTFDRENPTVENTFGHLLQRTGERMGLQIGWVRAQHLCQLFARDALATDLLHVLETGDDLSLYVEVDANAITDALFDSKRLSFDFIQIACVQKKIERSEKNWEGSAN